MNDLFFTADLHFGHRWMSEHRGFDTTEAMDENLIDRWNATIGCKDDVWVLGDFSFASGDEVERIFKALHGRHKYLVRGNHDTNRVFKLPWHEQCDLKRVKFMRQSLWLCHYPMLTWPNAHHGTYHLHGHSHGQLRAPETTRLDVGIDATGELALPAERVVDILDARTYDYVDHHQ